MLALFTPEALFALENKGKTAKKPTITVPSEKCKTLKEALEKASPGDIIYLKEGSYKYDVSMGLKDNIEIFGDGADRTEIIIGRSGMSLRSGVKFSNLSLKLTHGYITMYECEDIIITRCIICGRGGLGLEIKESSNIEIINCTLVDLMDAISFCYSPTQATIRNSIIANNRGFGIIAKGGPERTKYDPETGELVIIPPGDIRDIKINLYYNNFWNNRHNYCGCLPGENDIFVDPKFVSEDDYHLQADSPCIDAGDPSPKYKDPDGTRCDLGALPYLGPR